MLCALFVGQGCGRKDEPAGLKPNDATKPAASIAGYWSGELNVPGNAFRLGFEILPAEGTKFKATMDSFDQGLRDWPATVTQNGGKVVLEVDLKQSGLAKFDGQLSGDGQQLTGNWRQGPATLPLTLKHGDRATAVSNATRPVTLSSEELEQNKAAASKLKGRWEGALNVGGKELRLEFNVTPNADGTCSTTMKSLDQGGAAVPVKQTLLDKGEVTFSLPGIQGKYVGICDPDGKIMDGTWTQGRTKLSLTLEKK